MPMVTPPPAACAALALLAACARQPAASPASSPPAVATLDRSPPPPPPPALTAGFDRGAALVALVAAAEAARSCKREGGPTGIARVRVNFAPDGSASWAAVDSPPLRGTAVGDCIAAIFRGVHVPPFDGPTVSVSKSVTLD